MSERPLSPVDYLVIGHVTHDRLPGGGCMVGGTAAYSGLTAAALGRRVGILTCAGPDFDAGTLNRRTALVCRPAAVTTTFDNRYADGTRQQGVCNVAAPLSLEDVPEAWRAVPLVHIGPVMGECDPELVRFFAGRAFVGLTPQGWLRRADEAGRVTPGNWEAAEQLLPLASAVVLSAEDLQNDWDRASAWARLTSLLVVTQGAEGGTLFVDGTPHRFAAPEVVEFSPTGAGDVFAAVFFCGLLQGVNPQQAVHRAACLAARSVLRSGLDGVPDAHDLAVCGWSHLA